MTYWTLFKINKIRDINGGRGGREGGVYGAKRSGKEKNMYHGSSTGVWHHSGLLHQAVLGLHMGERLETFGERGGEAEWCKEQPWEESKSSTTTFTADSALGRLWKSSWRKGKKHPMEEQVYSFFPRSDPGDQLVSSFRVLVSKGFGHLGYRHHTCGRNSSSLTPQLDLPARNCSGPVSAGEGQLKNLGFYLLKVPKLFSFGRIESLISESQCWFAYRTASIISPHVSSWKFLVDKVLSKQSLKSHLQRTLFYQGMNECLRDSTGLSLDLWCTSQKPPITMSLLLCWLSRNN